MRALLDTHTFLWWVTDSDQLSVRARRVIGEGDNQVFFSAASAWEIAIKAGLRRVILPDHAERFIAEQLERNAFEVLPVQVEHALAVTSLPNIHKDPFDRLLVAQARLEDLVIVSRDRRLAGYSVRVAW